VADATDFAAKCGIAASRIGVGSRRCSRAFSTAISAFSSAIHHPRRGPRKSARGLRPAWTSDGRSWLWRTTRPRGRSCSRISPPTAFGWRGRRAQARASAGRGEATEPRRAGPRARGRQRARPAQPRAPRRRPRFTDRSGSPVIVLSDRVAEADRVRSFARGADDHVCKPLCYRRGAVEPHPRLHAPSTQEGASADLANRARLLPSSTSRSLKLRSCSSSQAGVCRRSVERFPFRRRGDPQAGGCAGGIRPLS
jgi:hypothetical protein